MRIGILTLRLYDNYGGILQNYALCKCLTDMGHDVESFDLQKPIRLKQKIKNIIRPKHNVNCVTKSSIDDFIQKYIPKTNYKIRFPSQFLIDHKIQQYDAYIVGSDQVWRRQYMEYGLKNMFLGFVRDNKKIKMSYAASFGLDNVCEYSDNDINKAKRYLSKFKGISVRENSGIQICKNFFKQDAVQVLDPTFLLPVAEYDRFADQDKKQNKGDLLVYFLDQTEMKKQVLNYILSNHNFIPFSYNTLNKDIDAPSVQQWLKGFRDAKFIVTDSFHGCVFSIIFNKTFIVIGNEKRGMSRFTSLLSLFGLEDRLLNTYNKQEIQRIFEKDINWHDVNSKLAALRDSSISFLKNHLS